VVKFGGEKFRAPSWTHLTGFVGRLGEITEKQQGEGRQRGGAKVNNVIGVTSQLRRVHTERQGFIKTPFMGKLSLKLEINSLTNVIRYGNIQKACNVTLNQRDKRYCRKPTPSSGNEYELLKYQYTLKLCISV